MGKVPSGRLESCTELGARHRGETRESRSLERSPQHAAATQTGRKNERDWKNLKRDARLSRNRLSTGEEAISALNAFLFHTSDPSYTFMLVLATFLKTHASFL